MWDDGRLGEDKHNHQSDVEKGLVNGRKKKKKSKRKGP